MPFMRKAIKKISQDLYTLRKRKYILISAKSQVFQISTHNFNHVLQLNSLKETFWLYLFGTCWALIKYSRLFWEYEYIFVSVQFHMAFYVSHIAGFCDRWSKTFSES